MTVPQIKVKVQRRPQLKLKMLPKFPASVTGEGGISVTNEGGHYVISPDLGVLGDVTGPGAGASVAGYVALFTGANNIEGLAPGAAGTVLTSDGVGVSFTNITGGYTTTVTAAGTTTLTVASNQSQFFTGATTQTVVLPVASTLTVGHHFFITNDSTGIVTVNSSGGNGVIAIPGGGRGKVTCILASGTTAASWSFETNYIDVTGGKRPAIRNSITFIGTDATSMTFPSTSATVARTDAANTFTGTQTFSALTASSAVATDGSKGLVSVTNTGTGNNVLATSPSLTTPSLGVATATSINGVTLDNNAWTSYTPTVTAQSGSITAYTATGRYKQLGKTVIMQADVTITTVGTATLGMRVTLPFTATAFNFAGTSREIALTGKAGSSNVLASGTVLDARDATGATYFASGAQVVCYVTYEIP